MDHRIAASAAALGAIGTGAVAAAFALPSALSRAADGVAASLDEAEAVFPACGRKNPAAEAGASSTIDVLQIQRESKDLPALDIKDLPALDIKDPI